MPLNHADRWRRSFAVFAIAWLSGTAWLSAESVTLFRVFLNDGTALVSYGEYAQVGDRLVFSMPIGPIDVGPASDPRLHVVNLPMSSINWTATRTYADSARRSHYIETRAAADYAALTGEVAAALNGIVLAKNTRARLDMALSARRRLATWPRDHYGYRAEDVREMLNLLDESISELRAAAGETSFALDLVATSPAPAQRELVTLLEPPTAAEAIGQAVAVAKATDVAADRISILRGVIAALDDRRSALPAAWVALTRRSALQNLRDEARVGRQYASLAAATLKRAATAAQHADVRGVENALAAAARRDTQLGHRRADEMNALFEQLRAQLDAAQRLRLARDQWHERSGAFRAYMKVVAPIIDALSDAQRNLDDIKSLAGSDASVLVALADQLSTNLKTLAVVSVPEELKPAHAVLTSAISLAETAARTRRQATISGELAAAWEASSAAAGSMMLLKRAKEDMGAAIRLPQLR